MRTAAHLEPRRIRSLSTALSGRHLPLTRIRIPEGENSMVEVTRRITCDAIANLPGYGRIIWTPPYDGAASGTVCSRGR